MQEFVRLAVGIVLLGLAIFVSLNFEDNSKVADADAQNEQSQEGVEKDTQPLGSLKTNWQAGMSKPARNKSNLAGELSKSTLNGTEIARPVFDQAPFAKPLPPAANNLRDSIQRPPVISDNYSAAQPLTVSGRLQRESGLVPVQPKPSFQGTLNYSHRIHTIRHGDTLQSLSSEYFGAPSRYLEIYRLNKDILSSPLNLPNGVEIRIPTE